MQDLILITGMNPPLKMPKVGSRSQEEPRMGAEIPTFLTQAAFFLDGWRLGAHSMSA